MKLRYFAAAMTEMVAGAATAAVMWIWTNADILETVFVMLLVAPLAGLAVLIATEPGEHKHVWDSAVEAVRDFLGLPRKGKHHERKAA